MKGMIHTATLHSTKQLFTLAYDGGTAAFTAGNTLTGETSHATAIIVSTGSIASGSLSLHTITGTFQNDEVLVDDGDIPGAAVSAGVIAEAVDGYGNLTYTTVDSSVTCRFFTSKDMIKTAGGGALYGETTLKVLLDGAVIVSDSDTITGTATGYASTFSISSVTPAYARSTTAPFNYTCELVRAS